ncbi:MAG: DUF4384 domain-containing protein, partial [Candidatus Hydrogenedens sp.]|nr:DUF4384 domain-containing protein [Candidatus Hydrogenedens sp.]
ADEAKRRAEDAERQAAAQRQSEAQRQADEAKRRAEDAERQAAAQRQAEAQRQADEAKRQAEAQRTAEAARTRLAAAGAALGQVKSALDRIDCSLLQAAMVDSGGFTVSGLAGPAASAPAIRRTIDEIAPGTPVEVAVEPVTQAMCDPLGAISQARTANAAVPKAVVVQTSSADAVYKNGQNLMLDVVAPDQTSYLQVDYFTLEGYVVHLFPNGLEKDNRLAAGKKRTLGNPAAGGRFWTIGPPFGRELIVAIATPKPLFPSLRPEAELASTYLQELKKALASAGGQASPPLASALFIKTVPN